MKLDKDLLFVNWKNIRRNIEQACRRVRRKTIPKVVVASKYMTVEQIRSLYEIGLKNFGENQVQAMEKKQELLSDLVDLDWHFIGHLQTNKVNKFLKLDVELLHSVDRIDLIVKLNEKLKKVDKKIDCLLEVNFFGEETKFGFRTEQQAKEAFDVIMKFSNINCIGVMTMAPYTNDETLIRKVFRSAKKFCDNLGLRELSMGMSNDYVIAVEEGATILRIGSAFLEH